MPPPPRRLPGGPKLIPYLAILERRAGQVQLGWDPESALVLDPPSGASSRQLCALLRTLDGTRSEREIAWQATAFGISQESFTLLLADLAAAGLLVDSLPEGARPATIRVHGRGPLADSLGRGLRGLGLVTRRSFPDSTQVDARRWHEDLIVLTDELVADPRLVAELVLAGTAHLQVRIRDGHGVIGPLVLPGYSSCLRCADLIRTDLDAEWPHLAAQLLGRVGTGSRAGVAATAAIALAELERMLCGLPAPLPATVNATLEIDLAANSLWTRPWPPHPDCGCRRVRSSHAGALTLDQVRLRGVDRGTLRSAAPIQRGAVSIAETEWTS